MTSLAACGPSADSFRLEVQLRRTFYRRRRRRSAIIA